jgi:group I intron endonuclease
MEKLNIHTLKTALRSIGIYKIKINDKEYIGSSCNIGHRLKHHLWSLENLKHHNRTMQNLYNKYGKEKIYFAIVEKCIEDVLIEREAYYINTLTPYINHILDPQKIVRDQVYKNRISSGLKSAYTNGLKPHNLRAVHKYSLEKGEYLESFESLTVAAKSINAKSVNSIKAVCKFQQTSAGGFVWSFYKAPYVLLKTKQYKLEPVLQFTTDNIFIKKWESIKQASKELNISNINRAISKDLTAGGYRWKKHKAGGPQ